MPKKDETEAFEEIEIDLDADQSGADQSGADEDERRVETRDRREIPDRRMLERVIVEDQPRRRNPDRRG